MAILQQHLKHLKGVSSPLPKRIWVALYSIPHNAQSDPALLCCNLFMCTVNPGLGKSIAFLCHLFCLCSHTDGPKWLSFQWADKHLKGVIFMQSHGPGMPVVVLQVLLGSLLRLTSIEEISLCQTLCLKIFHLITAAKP